MTTSFEERLKRMKQLSLISEAKYSLVDGIDEDDAIPSDVYEEPKPASPNDSTIFEDDEENPKAPAGEPAMDAPAPEGGEETPMDNPEEPTMDIPTEPQKSQEEVQNNILKLNVAALEKMQNVIDNIDNSLATLNSKYDKISGAVQDLSGDVEEVREPTNVEKLIRRKEDSHPYYYNLNNMWNGMSFQARLDQTGDQGIIQLDDGTYEANFDDLPKLSSQEIKDSFKNY